MTATLDAMVRRSNDLRTKRDIARVFVGRPSAQVLVGASAVLMAMRVAVGDFGRGDLAVLVATLVMVGLVEWCIHRYLLHAAEDSWTSRTLGTGRGHREHHLDPTDLDWLLLRGADAVVFVVAFGVLTAFWSLPLSLLLGSGALGPYLTGWMSAAIASVHYEWVHLLIHTRYRPRTPYYRRLARNHRLHHYRNEHHWLGVTTNAADRLLHTLPADARDVVLSDSARTLDAV